MSALAVALLLLALPGTAFAAGGGMSQEDFQAILALIGVASVAFIVTHFAAEWLQQRFGIVTGVEFMVVGVVLGPVFGLLTPETLTQLSPALVLGEGSLGLLAGLLLDIRKRDRFSLGAAGAGTIVSAATFILVTVPVLGGVFYFLGLDGITTYGPHILCAGAVACVASRGPLASLVGFLDARGEGAVIVVRVARACSTFAIVAFGLIFCLRPATVFVATADYGWFSSMGIWLGIHVGIGVVFGIIFTLFLTRKYEDDKTLTVLFGMVIFTSGCAHYLQLSPIFVCFILGLVMANISRHARPIGVMLISVERPLYIVLFFFFGASVQYDDVQWEVVAGITIAYLALRWVGRAVGGSIGARAIPSLRALPPFGPALMAPGALSAAMLLNFIQVYGDRPLTTEFFLALVICVMISEPAAYKGVRTWLIDATDVRIGADESRALAAHDEEEAA